MVPIGVPHRVAINRFHLDGASMIEIQSHAAVVRDHFVGVIDNPIDEFRLDCRTALASSLSHFLADTPGKVPRVGIAHDDIGARIENHG